MLELLIITILMNEPNVKFCKDFQTGKIVVIEAGFPCPFGTIEI